MRQSHHKKTSENNRRRGKLSQAVQKNNRLSAALKHGLDRPIESYPVFELQTHNPRTGQRHKIEIKHEITNGNNRYNVYLDGEKFRNQWSRTQFISWLFNKIEAVRCDWN